MRKIRLTAMLLAAMILPMRCGRSGTVPDNDSVTSTRFPDELEEIPKDYFLEEAGGTHSGKYAMEYFYNGVCWIWQ